MPDKIQLLPDTVANQIAAGEVVQRPASVVKELLENAVDAGATRIHLSIKDGGMRLLQVVDNGEGMTHTDARMCWERHATSKIHNAHDLFQIKTFGFRGEALASIASVARVEMLTKKAQTDLATLVVIEGGAIKKHEFAAGPNGTRISVKDLFYNIPARRNFLKSVAVETKHIMEEFIRAALAHPNIAFHFFNNERTVLDLPETSPVFRVCNVLGKMKPEQLLPLNEKTDIVSISGFVGSPQLAKRSRGDQYLFVNQRPIKDPYLQHAIKNAYQNLIPQDAFPAYVVHLELDPNKIDVNVHPAKTEVKFEEEKSMYAILHAVVKKALGALVSMPDPISYTPQALGVNHPTGSANHALTPASNQNPGFNPNAGINKKFNPFGNQAIKPRSAYQWEKLYEPFKETTPENNTQATPEPDLFSNQTPNPSAVDEAFQFDNLIVAKFHGEIYIIHILLARERVFYERNLHLLEKNKPSTQHLLFPKTLSFSPSDAELLTNLIDDIKKLGFDIAEFGNNTFVVNGLPSNITKGTEQKILENLLQAFKENQSKHPLSAQENLARSMAKNAATFATDNLGPAEIKTLVSELLACNFPKYCPFGRPVFNKLDRTELNKLFKL